VSEYATCLTDTVVTSGCVTAHNVDRLVQFGIPAAVVLVTLLAALVGLMLGRR